MTANVWALAAQQAAPKTPRWGSPAVLAHALDPTRVQTPALDLIDRELVDVAEGRTKRLMVFCPPQEGKTTAVAQDFPTWLLTHRPDTRIVIASYEAEIAARNGRRIRDTIVANDGTEGTLNLGLGIKATDRAAARWTLQDHLGGVYCVGVGGALTGRSADVLIVDDPVKDRETAESSTYRERVWDWWTSVARTRFGPDTAVVVIMTRWHSEDLAGKLLADASEQWRVVSIPAIADSPDDPLERAEGEPLVSARGRTLADWQSTRRSVGEYVWASLYQQRPAPLAGGIFKRDAVRFWSPMPADDGRRMRLDLDGRVVYLETCWRFLVADLAASVKTSADYTVIAAFGYSLDGDLIVLDLHRSRMTPDKHFDAARPMFARWGAQTLYVEQMMHTTTLVSEASRAGMPILPLQPDKDKITRALPAAAKVEQGRVWVPREADWSAGFLNELAAFPNGRNDDMVDVLGYGQRLVGSHYLPPMSAADEAALRTASLDDLAFDRMLDHAFPSTGQNLMTVEF